MNWVDGRVVLELGYKCNHHCLYCKHNDKYPARSHLPDMSVFDLELICDSLIESMTSSNQQLYLQLTGGEPTIYSELFDTAMKKFLNSPSRLSFGVNTNLTGDVDRLIYWSQRRPFHLCISLPSLDESIYEATTRVKGSYSRFMTNLEKCFLSGISPNWITFNIVVTKLNESLTPKVVEDLASIGITCIGLTEVMNGIYNEPLSPDNFDLCRKTSQALVDKYQIKLSKSYKCVAVCEGIRERSWCTLPNSFTLRIQSDGEVFPCSCGIHQPMLGHLPHDSLQTILERRSIYFDQKIKPESCCENWGKICYAKCKDNQPNLVTDFIKQFS